MLTASQREATPTVVADVGVVHAPVAVEERRTSNRIHRKLSIRLAVIGWTEVRSCAAEDVSEGGLYLRVLAGYGLGVGQRCEVSFVEETESHELSNVAGILCYATVVRTEVIPAASGDLIGAGLRFDQPLFL